MKILLMEDIPQEFNNRMLNDTRYISRLIMTLLSKVVGEEGEEGAKSKHIINTNGRMTSELKRQWGLNEVWNHLITPRFERLNQRLNTTEFGEMREVDGKRFFQTQVPLHLPPVNRKRIDHRHHALDAIVIACTTLNHVTYFNSVAAKDEVQGVRYDLRRLLCEKRELTIVAITPGRSKSHGKHLHTMWNWHWITWLSASNMLSVCWGKQRMATSPFVNRCTRLRYMERCNCRVPERKLWWQGVKNWTKVSMPRKFRASLILVFNPYCCVIWPIMGATRRLLSRLKAKCAYSSN